MKSSHFIQCIALGISLYSGRNVVAQALPENWQAPPKTKAVRDPAGIALIQASLRAMNPQGLPPIQDLSMTCGISRWFGRDATGTLSESAIGMEAELISVNVGGQTAYTSYRDGGKENHKASEGLPGAIINRRPIEQLPHLPQPLLQELLNNSLDDVQLLDQDPDQPDVSRIRVTLRPLDWQPYMRDLRSANIELYITNSNHLPEKIISLNHFDGNPRHLMPSELRFSEYGSEQGYLVPHAFEERYVGKSMNLFLARTIVLNQGVSAIRQY